MSEFQFKTLDEDTFDTALKSDNEPKIVGFYSEHCEPCAWEKEVWSEISGSLGVKVFAVDVGENPAVAHRMDVEFVPTTAVVRDGDIVFWGDGYRDLKQMVEEVSEFV